jgi:exonuclease III
MIFPYNKKGFTEKKAAYIEKYNADIYIIQECTEYDMKKLGNFKKNKAWYGDKKVDSIYGIGIFSDTFNIKLLDEHNPEFRYIVPFKIFNESHEFILFAVWTKGKDPNKKQIAYTKQTWNAINFNSYKNLFKSSVVIIGDFNSNNFWEKDYQRYKIPSHQDIINKLSEYGIESAYHKYYECENGKEKDPTEFYKMNINKKYHVDYCFLSSNFKIKEVKVGGLVEWKENKFSDHCPISVEFNF